MTEVHATLVLGPAPSAHPQERLRQRAALAGLAFGSAPSRHDAPAAQGRHLAFLSVDALDLDLNDPAQRKFGDYELVEKLGQGGMGVVYRARQLSLQREVALKLLAAGPWASQDFIERFRREAQSAARMQHPNIVAIHEIGAKDELNFFSMRLVRGPSLAALLAERGPFPPRRAAELVRTIAEALDYAHRLGVLHLDLKPANVLIDEHEQAQVADFGLARRLDESLTLDNDEVSGTPSYMAPEQAQVKSHKLSPATDIYGLGAILYELLTGRPPFLAATPQETLRRLTTEAPQALRAHDARIPLDLEAICLKCLAKEPARRYATARELADDLGRFLDNRETRARLLNPFQRFWRLALREPRLSALAALLMVSLAVGFGATSVQWRRAERNVAAAGELLWASRREAAVRLEREGRGFEALPRLVANIEEQERAGKTQPAQLERRRVGMLLAQGATEIDRMVVADANPLALDLSADGSLLALALNNLEVRWYDTATLRERGRVSLQGRVSSDGQVRAPRLLRFIGNERLRVTLDWFSNSANPTNGDSWLIDLAHASVVEPPPAFADRADVIYSDDGNYALLRNRTKQVQLWQVAPWQPRSPLSPPTADFQPWLIGPDARYAAYLSVAMRKLVLYQLPKFAAPTTIELPGDVGVSAWAQSGDGRVLALGDFEGRLFLLDPHTHALRLLPTPHSREVTWVAFSEDDAWLAAVTWDGTAYAFDVASGNPLVAGQMHHDFVLQRVAVSHRERLLVATGKSETALWHLPLPGPRAVPAQRVGASPLGHAEHGDYASGWSFTAGLFANAGIDGQVRLWRLPLGPSPPARAAFQVPEQTWFDGKRLVDVEWNRVRIVSPTGAPFTAWTELPQPPGFAELVDGGSTLLVTTGPELRVFDAADLRPRYPPVALGASPERLLVGADGASVVLAFSANDADGFVERLQRFDLRNGRRLQGEAKLAAPLRRLVFSLDGTRLLAVGPADTTTTVLAGADLSRLGEYQHEFGQSVLWGDFSLDGREVLLATQSQDVRLGNDGLLVWDPAGGAAPAMRPTGSARPLGVVATSAGPFVATTTGDLVDPGGVRAHAAEKLAQSEPTAVVAVSADRSMVAHAFRREVQLYDAASGAALGPPLQGDADAIDVIVQLAFAPDGRTLLARTVESRWLVWSIAPEARTARELEDERARESLESGSRQALLAPTSPERARLRAHDPGAWPERAARPAVATAATVAGLSIPLRAPGLSPLLLDLGSYYNVAPDEVHNAFYSVRPMLRPIPAGVQRIGGVDYDIRGIVQVGAVILDPLDRDLGSVLVKCLALPDVPVAALDFLAQTSQPAPVPDETATAVMTLHYRDGSSAALPIRTQREVPGFAGRDQAVRFALGTDAALVARGFASGAFSNPRLLNPHPERGIRCLDLGATDSGGPMALLAITAEPVIVAAASGSSR